jgi:hypothetical protein
LPSKRTEQPSSPDKFYKGGSQEETHLRQPEFFLLPSPPDPARVLICRALDSVCRARWPSDLGFFYQRFSSPIATKPETRKAERWSCANHGCIGDSWPIAFSGCPRGPRVGCETTCPRHIVPNLSAETRSRTRVSLSAEDEARLQEMLRTEDSSQKPPSKAQVTDAQDQQKGLPADTPEPAEAIKMDGNSETAAEATRTGPSERRSYVRYNVAAVVEMFSANGGTTHSRHPCNGILESGLHLLAKPYSRENLNRKVRRWTWTESRSFPDLFEGRCAPR